MVLLIHRGSIRMLKWEEWHRLNNATDTVYFGHKLFRKQSVWHFRSSSFRAAILGIENSQEWFVKGSCWYTKHWIHKKSSGAGLQACLLTFHYSYYTVIISTLLKRQIRSWHFLYSKTSSSLPNSLSGSSFLFGLWLGWPSVMPLRCCTFYHHSHFPISNGGPTFLSSSQLPFLPPANYASFKLSIKCSLVSVNFPYTHLPKNSSLCSHRT